MNVYFYNRKAFKKKKKKNGAQRRSGGAAFVGFKPELSGSFALGIEQLTLFKVVPKDIFQIREHPTQTRGDAGQREQRERRLFSPYTPFYAQEFTHCTAPESVRGKERDRTCECACLHLFVRVRHSGRAPRVSPCHD